MIKGLELAGRNPTRSSFISNLRKLSKYNAGGLLPNSVSFTHFGHGNSDRLYVRDQGGRHSVRDHPQQEALLRQGDPEFGRRLADPRQRKASHVRKGRR